MLPPSGVIGTENEIRYNPRKSFQNVVKKLRKKYLSEF